MFSSLQAARLAGRFVPRSRSVPAGGLFCAMVVMLLLIGSTARGDVIKLNNGGELRGQMNRSQAATGEGPLEIETLSGIRVLVSRDDVLLFSFRSLKTEEYETLARNAPRTVEAQWELYQHCRRNNFREESQSHLEQVIEIDPDHEEARKLLDHVRHKGVWVPREEMMLEQGYVKYKRRYITLQEMALIERSTADAEAEREWTDRIRRWQSSLNSSDPNKVNAALTALREISDPKAIAGLVKVFRNHPHKDARLLMVQVLAGIASEKIVEPLTDRALFDSEGEVRLHALAAIPQRYYPQAAHVFAYRLRHSDNTVVRHAGIGLKHVGDEQVLGDLINALVTTHTVTVQVPVRKATVSFGGSQPILPPEVEAGLSAGKYPFGVIVAPPVLPADIELKQVNVKRVSRNQEVLAALEHLTGESFGFDERAWRLWLASYKNRGGSLSKSDSAG
jgi:hypothetical protein